MRRSALVLLVACSFASGSCASEVVDPSAPVEPGRGGWVKVAPWRADAVPVTATVAVPEPTSPRSNSTPPTIAGPDPGCVLRPPARMASDCRILLPVDFKATGQTDEAHKAARASDGDLCTHWNSGGQAPQSIVVDLGAPTDIDAIVLVPEMLPNGAVVHRVELSDDGKSFSSGHRIEAPMQSGAPVELVLPKRERTRFVRVVSDKSPSWIAWREVAFVRCGATAR